MSEDFLTDFQFWLFLAAAVPLLFLPIGIAMWKGGKVWPVLVLSIVFWPGALALALRMKRSGSRMERSKGLKD